MKNRKLIFKRVVLAVFLICLLALLPSCRTVMMKNYYSDKENYVNATGIVTDISYDEEYASFFLAFSDLEPTFSAPDFEITGKNVQIVKQNGIDEKLEIGDRVEFVSATEYFGNGYFMPIVAMTVIKQEYNIEEKDNSDSAIGNSMPIVAVTETKEELLKFEEGYKNYLEWLDEQPYYLF